MGRYLHYAVLPLWAILAFSYTLSPALISISFVLLCILGFAWIGKTKFSSSEKLLMAIFVAFYLSSSISVLYSSNQDEAIRKLVLKLPILCFPLLYTTLKQIVKNDLQYFNFTYQYALFVPAFVSVYNYFLNKTLFDQLILESKPLPIEFGYGIYHIQFSILLAASVLFGIYLHLKRKIYLQNKFNINLNIILTVCNLLFIHILSARTGLLSLYAGLAILALTEGRKLPAKVKLIGFSMMLILPICMYFLSTSLQNRIKNSYKDIQVVWAGTDANDYSFALRVNAWKNATDIIQKHPINGVGIGDAEKELYENFAFTNSKISPQNRKNPHFQFLETAVQSGLISAILFLLIPLVLVLGKFNSPLAAALAILFLLASCFESILERQVSVIAFTVLPAFALLFKNKDV